MTNPAIPWERVAFYLDGLIRPSVVGAALELGLVDRLEGRAGASPDVLARELAVDARELEILMDLLAQHEVLAPHGDGELTLATRFREVLPYRDLLEAQLDYQRHVTRAMTSHYASAVREPHRFLGALIGFFHFDARPNFDAALLDASRPWVRYMSTLTRYHVPFLLDAYDFSRARRWLDLGGNNGEQAIQIARRHPEATVTVVDTPVVCALGREHLERRGGEGGDLARLRDAVRFDAVDLARGALPGGFDGAIAKSLLHDWNEEGARRILDAVARALPPGAPFVIFEGERYDLKQRSLPDAEVANLPFLSHYRPASWYVDELGRRGFRVERVERVAEIHFMLIETSRS
ncbi:MAG: hypothetical protein KF901_13035 [Myxococcales bacterium]|nr:hypothetical protein [Myxococcales bacterium]